jgi:D-alanyl-lipoteichoic acid acyltransferase DltB (MBOAT superfamily)
MSEFWHRWHISLISWLTDYIYTPLSFYFRKYAIRGIVISLMITFMISGIWHGAALTFVVWGLIQGVYLSYEAIMRNRRAQFENKYKLNGNFIYVSACIVNTIVLFSASLIFGRAPDIGSAFMVFKKIFASQGPLFIGDPSTFVFILIGLPMLLIKDFMDEFAPSRMLLFENKYKAVRVLSYSFIIIFILLIGVLDGGQFIYFKF